MIAGVNISSRKFFKWIGLTSQDVIETALRDAAEGDNQSYEEGVGMTVKGLKLQHIVIVNMKG